MWALFDFACEGKLLGSSRTFKQEYENPIVRVRTCLFYFAVRFLKQELQAEFAFSDEFLRFQSLNCLAHLQYIVHIMQLGIFMRHLWAKLPSPWPT